MKPSLEELEQRDIVGLVRGIAQNNGTTVESMFSRSQKGPDREARRSFYRILRDNGWTYHAIGRFVGRDHGSVFYAAEGRKPQ